MSANDFRKEYRRLLQRAEYRRLRDRILERDGWLCQEPDCGAPAQEVHHVRDTRSEGLDSPLVWDEQNLISLCKRCHNAKHPRTEKPPGNPAWENLVKELV